ncbi:molybdopterin-dependent oxidoreductase [Billgrantia ethanolica]|uniref:Molybdopterin-dependent oxidoreductase n=1 Tax=Billgrantia ethanolica TaxID=2733486 RepID=A0ABS9A3T7_9GAMM|nr:molybdopterin-dependent oxidoreductase [Halomonas ethanolica]MCE8003411.1 molybdopterin-dependent oxidoreductase [Halomonas ethanolica]
MAVTALLLSSTMLPVQAAPLPPPEGEVLLRVMGNIEHPNVDGELQLDLDQLMTLSPHVIETATPWTEGVGRFEGPLFRAVLEAAGAEGERVRVASLNEYEIEIPFSDLHDYDVILAVMRDGEPIAVRDLGPVLVLYPFDEHPELLNETIRHRSVWHVGTVDVQ